MKTRDILSCLFMVCAMGWLGCQSESPPEQAYRHLQKAVLDGHHKQIWASLASVSQQRLHGLLQAQGVKEDAQTFFLRSVLSPNRRLRRTRQPIRIEQHRATLFFQDELEQPVQIVMLEEQRGIWRLLLQGHFVGLESRPHPPTTHPTPPDPRTKTSQPTKNPSSANFSKKNRTPP